MLPHYAPLDFPKLLAINQTSALRKLLFDRLCGRQRQGSHSDCWVCRCSRGEDAGVTDEKVFFAENFDSNERAQSPFSFIGRSDQPSFFSWRRSLDASASSQSRKVTIFGSVAVAFGQIIQ